MVSKVVSKSIDLSDNDRRKSCHHISSSDASERQAKLKLRL